MATALEHIIFGNTAVAPVSGASQRQPESGGEFKEMFTSLLQEKRDSLKETLEEMGELRQELKELREMRRPVEVEVIRRTMPDGSILVTEYPDGEIASRFRKRPHMVDVPDPSAALPRNSEGNVITGEQKMKQVPKFSVLEDFV